MERTAAAVTMQRVSLSGFAGILLVLLGGTVMLGWALEIAPVVRVLPDYTSMPLNTALSFVLAGTALLLPRSDPVRYRRATSAFGSALLILAVLVLGEHAFRVDLGIDWASLHAWLHDSSRSPGRMSAGTASAFLMSGVVLMLATRVRTVGL